MAKKHLSAQRLKELLHYDPETGLFRRFKRFGGHGSLDKPGWVSKNGYLMIKVGGGAHLVHRLAWLYATGCWPEGDIDHRDGNKSNNRLENLRDIPRHVQLQNLRRARSDNASTFLGVGKTDGGYRARITLDGKTVHIGKFSTPEEAHAAYVAAKRRLHPFGTL